MPGQDPEELVASMKKAAAALREAGIPFALGGGLACWAYGAPPSAHDADVMVRPQDAEAALQALVGAGMRPERPPEDWLLKAYDGDVLVDIVFRPVGEPVTDEMLSRSVDRELEAMRLPILRVEDVLTTKVLALDERNLDYAGLLTVARAVREQVDWPEVRERTKGSPFSRAFFALLEDLAIVPEAGR